MKKKPPPDKMNELVNEFMVENPRLLLSLLPDEMFPNGERDNATFKVECVDLEAMNREAVSLPYHAADPLLQLIKEQPEVLLTLMRTELGMKLPAYSQVVVEEQDLDHIEPQAPTHTVILCKQGRKTVYAVALDVLRQVESEKTFHWPLNTALLHIRTASRTALVVLAAGADVEAWASIPNYWQGEEFSPFTPVVIGPSLFSYASLDAKAASVAKDPARATLAALLGSLQACG